MLDDHMISLRVRYCGLHSRRVHSSSPLRRAITKTKSHDPCIFIIVTSKIFTTIEARNTSAMNQKHTLRLNISMQTLYHARLKTFSLFFPLVVFTRMKNWAYLVATAALSLNTSRDRVVFSLN